MVPNEPMVRAVEGVRDHPKILSLKSVFFWSPSTYNVRRSCVAVAFRLIVPTMWCQVFRLRALAPKATTSSGKPSLLNGWRNVTVGPFAADKDSPYPFRLPSILLTI